MSPFKIMVAGGGNMDAKGKLPAYLLTYDHGGVILWGREQFRERLRDGISWLERYPSF